MRISDWSSDVCSSDLYQPRLALQSSRITGVEALLRWTSEEHGEIPPSEFIPLAEESGQILEIGEWVLREACLTLHRWRQHGLADLNIAVNMSVLQLLRGNFPRSEEHTSELQSLMRISYAVFCLKKKQ